MPGAPLPHARPLRHPGHRPPPPPPAPCFPLPLDVTSNCLCMPVRLAGAVATQSRCPRDGNRAHHQTIWNPESSRSVCVYRDSACHKQPPPGRPPPPRWLSRRGDASGPHGSTYDCKESAVQFCTAHGKYGGTMIDRSMLPDVQEAGALDGLFWTKWSSSSLSGIPNHGIETPPLIRGPYFLIFLAHLQSFWIHAVPPPPPRSARNPSCRLHRSIVTAPPSPRHSPLSRLLALRCPSGSGQSSSCPDSQGLV